ncbi:MAG: alpha/beta fold hydrolase [Thermodesulfobacteriota bacterium]
MNDHGLDISGFRHLYPFPSRFLDRDGLKYHYLDEGSGEPVLMVHGNPTWSFYYRSLVQGLSGRYRTIVPDHIGCGLSDKPPATRYGYRLKDRVEDLEALLDHLELKEKVTLIVHDWGGAIGLAWAVRHPERVGRLVITNTAAFLPPRGKRLPWRLRLIRDLRFFAAPAVLLFNAFAGAALYMAARKKLRRDVKAGLIAPYNTPANRIATLKFVQDIPLAPGDPSYDLVAGVETKLPLLEGRPMLICWGGRDFVFDSWYLEEWRRRFPAAEVHVFSAAGHYLLEDEPEETLRRVKDFLARHPL